MTSKRTGTDTWWGTFSLAEGATARWRIGPLTVTALRRTREWQLGWEWVQEAKGAEEPSWSFEQDAPETELANLERHAFREAPGSLAVLPVLADRAVVTSPRVPLFLPPGESATLYVGSPLWLRLSAGEPPRTLREIPVRRPSDTWFGPSTREGELCYAVRTRAALEAERLLALPHRAVTPVTVDNRSPQPLTVERMKLPVRHLALYTAPDRALWTEAVSLTSRDGSEMASLEIDRRPPPEAGAAERLTGPREDEGGFLTRAFSSLLWKGE